MNHLPTRPRYLLLLLLSSALLVSCDVSSSGDDNDTEQESSYEITNDDTTLETRYLEKDQDIAVDTTKGEDAVVAKNLYRAKRQPSFTLKLVSEVEPPTVQGEPVQATMVSFDDNITRSVVSYNKSGAGYRGGIDVLQIVANGRNISVRSSIHFFDADINAVYADENRVYSALATTNPDLVSGNDRSALQAYNFSGFDLIEAGSTSASLPSFAANSVTTHGTRVYATSGSDGGLTVYDESLGQLAAFVALDDARWVDVNDNYIAVLLGDDDGDDHGSIVLIDSDTFDIVAEYPFEGAYTAEAKNTVELVNHLAFIGAGKAGVQVMDLTTGDILASIPIPDPAKVGLSPDVVATNAVSVDENKIFISNGEAGVYVAETGKAIFEYASGENIEVTLLGQLQFDELESVNHVAYRDQLLVVAAGTGGVKTVALTDK